jgi:hypothetical protein
MAQAGLTASIGHSPRYPQSVSNTCLTDVDSMNGHHSRHLCWPIVLSFGYSTDRVGVLLHIATGDFLDSHGFPHFAACLLHMGLTLGSRELS